MSISRKVGHEIVNRLQVIVGEIELGHKEIAIRRMRELSNYIIGRVESVDEERERTEKEGSD